MTDVTEARSEVLARVRAALGAAPPAGAAEAEPAAPAYRVAGEHAPGSAAALDLLVDRLVDYQAHVVRVAADGVGDAVLAAVGHAGDRQPVTSSADRSADDVTDDRSGGPGAVVVPPGLDPAWVSALAAAGIEVRTDTRQAPLSNAELDAAAAVVTAARVAIAETGTIVLDGEPDQGRRAISLVPDVHVCVVRADQVVQTVPEAVRLLTPHADRPQTWISGPSATSDIELDRVEGVHGPRTLHVVLVG